MKINFLQELQWRGMLHDSTPGAAEALQQGMQTGYLGCDPTAPSLTIGNLASVIMLMHFQRAGHRPIALVGGATGMVGDPSGKNEERQLRSIEELEYNLSEQKKILQKLLDFDEKSPNGALMVNNYDWFKDMGTLSFLRDIGKHISINYMLAKDSVKNRLETGLSFTEFSYQLIQGFDFKYLYDTYNCRFQFGGSDQWGNMTTGTELIRRMGGGDVYCITAPLITKADGTKIGKTESGAIYLTPELTSSYKFFQYWLNVSDEDAPKFLRRFTFLPKEDIEQLETEHNTNPGARVIQRRLAQEITTLIHGETAYQNAVNTSQILFGKATHDALLSLSEADLLDVFEGVPQYTISKTQLETGIDAVGLLAQHTQIYASNGEVRRALKENAISINQQKIADGQSFFSDSLLNGKYLLVQKGKKNYFLIVAE